VNIVPLEGLLAAQVEGVNIANLSDAEFGVIHRALLAHSVVVLRGQNFTPRQQVDFSKRFGAVEIRPLGGKPSAPAPDGSRLPDELVQIIYEGGKGLSTDMWHSDASYLAAPPALTMATLRVQPGAGGDTMFASQYAAYDGLSDAFRAMLRTETATHRDPRSDAPEKQHPVVITHPETGRPSLFVNPMFTTRVDQLGDDESSAVLRLLFAHQVKPEFVYRHAWQPGDLVIWDNRCTLHYAIKDYGPARRVLHRTTVIGAKPVAAAA
jgi:taurine dioxygenase